MAFKHNDCIHFSSIDVAKGLCRINGSMVEIDSEVCSSFDKKPKCKFCTNFKNPDSDGIGTCVGLDKEDWIYGELNAVTCPKFAE